MAPLPWSSPLTAVPAFVGAGVRQERRQTLGQRLNIPLKSSLWPSTWKFRHCSGYHRPPRKRGTCILSSKTACCAEKTPGAFPWGRESRFWPQSRLAGGGRSVVWWLRRVSKLSIKSQECVFEALQAMWVWLQPLNCAAVAGGQPQKQGTEWVWLHHHKTYLQERLAEMGCNGP